MKNKKHKCKLCTKSFLNGRALGGHMRSHFVMATLPLRPTHQQPADSSSSNSDIHKLTSKNEEEEKSCAVPDINRSIRRRGKPKMRMPSRETATTNPEFIDSVTESETVSAQDQYPTPPMPRRPYKRARSGGRQLKPAAEGRGGVSGSVSKKCKRSCLSSVESDSVATESVPASTVSSDGLMTHLDEDVAMWLVMLSRDKWEEKDKQQQVLLKKETGIELLNNNNHHHQLSTTDRCLPCKKEEEEEEEDERQLQQQHLFELDCSNSKSLMSGQKPRSKKKGKRSVSGGFGNSITLSMETGENCGGKRDRVFECPDCCKVFGSAQAFGGHKRWRHHPLLDQGPSPSPSPTNESSGTKANACSSSSDIGSGRVEWIDLNLPPPGEDEEDYYNEILVH